MKYCRFIFTFCLTIMLLIACSDDDNDSVFIPFTFDNPKNKIMFFSSNWGTDSINITDDILSYDDGSTATTRIISGALTTINNPDIDSITVDKNRSILYLTDAGTGNIIVYEDIQSIAGDIAPDRTISVSGESSLEGIAIDSARDILYVSGSSSSIWIFKNASTLDGTLTPDAILSYDVMSIFIDETNNRLYAGAYYGAGNAIYVFDSASSLNTGATADRTITFLDNFDPTGLWVDSKTNRLYTCNNSSSTGGNYLFIYEDASTMDGTSDPDTDSVARIGEESISLMVDSKNNLYAWPDSATYVRIYSNASSLTGDISAADKTINGVVARGYGMDYLAY